MTEVMWLKLLIWVMWLIDWADGANKGDGTDGTDVAEMALGITHERTTLFDCLGHMHIKICI